MKGLEELSYIHLVRQLEEENKKLKEENISLRKLIANKRYGNYKK